MSNRKDGMIKKSLALLFLLHMVIGLGGCKGIQKAEEPGEMKLHEEQIRNEKQTPGDEEQIAGDEEQEESEDLVLFDKVSNIAVIVDRKTMEAESYELPENRGYVCGDKEKLYYVCWESERDYYGIYAVDRRNGETALVGEKYMKEEPGGGHLAQMETYGGKVYALWACWRDNWTETTFRESVYILQEDGTYTEAEENQSVYDKMEEKGYQLINGMRRMENKCLYSVPFCLEEFGEIYAETSGGELVVLDGKGEVKRTYEQPDDLSGIVLLQKNSMIYIDEDEKLMLYDRDQNVSKVIMEGYSYIFEDEEGILYYYQSRESEYGIFEYEVYRYDMEREENTLLYSVRSVPGIQEYVPGISGFCVKEGQCYYIGTDGADMAWYMFDPATGKEEMLETNRKLKHYGYSDYGTVTCQSERAVCPNCGQEIFLVYAECFVLDDSFSNAEKINAYLREEYEQTTDDAKQYEEEKQDECEWHAEEFYLVETVDQRLKNVEKVGGHYLQVYMEGSWYGGGAHGMPFRDYLLFDLDTGEPVTFRDLYRGSEEEFRKLAVEYTVADWKKGENGYFAQTEEELGEEVYESVSMDMLIRFGKDGIILEYSPYWLGSFADGFIEVPIPYEALDMDENFVK